MRSKCLLTQNFLLVTLDTHYSSEEMWNKKKVKNYNSTSTAESRGFFTIA